MSNETMYRQQIGSTDYPVPAGAAEWQKRALIVGVVGALVCIAGAVTSLDQFMRGYLIAYMFWTGLSLGCLALLMVQYLSAGLWGLVIRRVLESAAKCLPLMLLLFLPILVFRTHLYAWMTNPALTERNHWYLNMPGWIIRCLVYFAIWIGLQVVLSKRGDTQDYPLTGVRPHFQGLSGIGLVVYALTVSFAAVDWIMSLDPTWGSTIYGLIFVAGQGLSALAFSVIMLTVFTNSSPYREIIKPMQFHDLGKLMLAFVMLFAYFSFSQWLIIWAGNLPEEIGWFLHRIRGGWGVVALIIILFHFALPFALLLSRERKRDGRRLIGLALLLMVMRLVDIYWYVVPNFAHAQGHFYLSLWYIVAPIGVGGLWLAFFCYNLRQRPLLPAYEPQIPILLHQRGHGH
ncbi:MAG TPA: hypothetical protein VKG65_04155 [Terriglobales bacterium]|nr:hypothetical protein [Terriglobales bacterium]